MRSFVIPFLAVGAVLRTDGFVPRGRNMHQQNFSQSCWGRATAGSWKAHYPTRLLMAKVWDRMDIEDDEEPMWYVLNCVAGLEMDLLRQCRQRCEDMEDVVKFVVPTVTKTRSHGANRMVKDTKVKYQGYVFAKLRLCAETYEAIQELDLCRSWMGTINYNGMKKLPPAPLALNKDEIKKFGLEEGDDEEAQGDADGDNVILDSSEEDEKAAEMEEVVKKVYRGLRVDDMVKVTARNKFFDEDGIVRRLKEGKVLIQFYTYGTMYDEWLDPNDVRKLSNIEILKGLSGPSRPITQRDLDGPSQGDRRFGNDRDDRNNPRRNMVGSFGGGGPRNRRQDKNANEFRAGGREDPRERENWYQYREIERRNQGGWYSTGENDIRRSNRQGSRWVQGDVDSQWGRTTQRQNWREKKMSNNPANNDDWSEFVSPDSAPPSQAETDDFFSSLMTDLSKDLDADKADAQNRGASSTGRYASSSDEDDFFASLMSEIEVDSLPGSSRKTAKDESDSTSDFSNENDFFASLEQEVRESNKQSPKQNKKASSIGQELDDFFSGNLDDSSANYQKSRDDDDFVAGLEWTLQSDLSVGEHESNSKAIDDDGFKFRGFDFLSDEPQATKTKAKSKKISHGTAESQHSTTSLLEASSLQKCTVPVLKDMLRDRGLKVTGKKSELIDRLTTSA